MKITFFITPDFAELAGPFLPEIENTIRTLCEYSETLTLSEIEADLFEMYWFFEGLEPDCEMNILVSLGDSNLADA
jgi:hypothetical protein